MRLLWRRFFLILTHNRALAEAVPNVRRMQTSSPWVPLSRNDDGGKTERMSLIASEKRSLEGHRLRHTIVDWIRSEKIDVDILGRAYKPLANKEDGLLPYKFSLVIENSREPSYFTEKLLDCICCNAIPIYWGAPDISDYFDTRGMVICNTEADLRNAASRLGDADYERMRPFALKNRELAEKFLDYQEDAMRIVLEEALDPQK